MSIERKGRILNISNNTPASISEDEVLLLGRLNISSTTSSEGTSILGRLNVHTMETGDGRDIELGIVGDNICWRRVGNVQWIELLPLSDISPTRGVDYWTSADKQAVIDEVLSQGVIANVVTSVLSSPSLTETLASKIDASELEDISANNLLTVDDEGSFSDTGICCTDIATKEDVNAVVQDRHYTHKQLAASSEWVIVHNLSKMPSVVVTDSAGSAVVGETIYVDKNTVKLVFNSEFSGTGYCN